MSLLNKKSILQSVSYTAPPNLRYTNTTGINKTPVPSVKSVTSLGILNAPASNKVTVSKMVGTATYDKKPIVPPVLSPVVPKYALNTVSVSSLVGSKDYVHQSIPSASVKLGTYNPRPNAIPTGVSKAGSTGTAGPMQGGSSFIFVPNLVAQYILTETTYRIITESGNHLIF